MLKICGLTRLEDLLSAWDLGVWATGFVFAPSPRRLTPAAARQLICGAREARRMAAPTSGERQRRRPLTVGVFGDASADEIAAVAREVDLDGVQLHGLASPGGDAVRRAPAARTRPLLIIQALPVDPETTDAGSLAQAIAAARREADIVLVDTKAAGRFGGSGRSFPWSLVREAAEGGPLLVAGGIGSENVQTALRESGAWGVDVSSGVERAPGIKDPGLMGEVVANAGVSAGAGAWVWARACPDTTAGAGAARPSGAAADGGGADRPQEG